MNLNERQGQVMVMSQVEGRFVLRQDCIVSSWRTRAPAPLQSQSRRSRLERSWCPR